MDELRISESLLHQIVRGYLLVGTPVFARNKETGWEEGLMLGWRESVNQWEVLTNDGVKLFTYYRERKPYV